MVEKCSVECPICLTEDINDPVETPCHHIYCNKCINTALSIKPTCPMCRAAISSKTLKAVVKPKPLSDRDKEKLQRQQDAIAISASHKEVLDYYSIDFEPDTDNNCDNFVMNVPIDIMEVMIKLGLVSTVNCTENQMMGAFYTALNYRIGDITLEETKCLLDLGAIPNIKSRFGETALHLALLFEDNPEKVALLLRYGADKEIKNYSGETALDYAIKYNRTKCIKILG